MNSRVDKIQDFIKTNVSLTTNSKKGKQVLFFDQLPSSATINLRNEGPHRVKCMMNYVYVDDEAVEMVLAILSLQSDKDLPDPYKDHPFHQGMIDEEIPVVIAEQDINSKEEEEQTKAEPNLYTYKPRVPYPQAINRPKAKANESDDHL